MIHHERTLDIDATPEAVWAVIGRYMHIDEFAPLVTSVEALTDGDDGLGSKRRCTFENGSSLVEEVIGWDPGRGYRIRASDLDPMPLHEMLAECDAVVIAAPATPETRHLIDAEALATMPSHSVLVNVARGSLLDEAALAEAMRQRSIAAAVLDVFDPEPLAPESPLWDLPGVYISAHSSVSVDRYMDDVFDLVFDNVQRRLAGEPLRNVVDMEALGFE